ncbi:branched-chain amino acid ABC transporter permease [Spongiactinospora gelatinilytica]|uniref:Branched-chain amino acid ABC transporter permease n=1 Tax=Spongiactinospora gelatinilytica TaxID=2666298 RepID=A0A2W2IB17_9ACTN|nr:branched-chain amino acid ABC transporter permease [Spongiactinospora gelatinilytica]PZG55357.1 branched-chain amino acid ABC transporter permease [Spongiactinospora gelatinilytica]
MATLAQQIVNGLVLGALIGLIALGYTMVYGIVQLINFAHGEVFMVGAFGAHFISLYVLPEGVPWYAALPVMFLAAVAVSVVVAMAMERLAYRPLRGAHTLAPLITALGVSILLQEVVRVFYPGATAPLPFPRAFPDGSLAVGPVTVLWTGVLALTVAPLLGAAVHLYVERSRLGRAMRATAQDADAARLMGIDTDRVTLATFVIGGVLAGVGAVLYGIHYTQIDTAIGFQNGIFAFTAAVLGGIGSIRGAMLGALCLGLVKSLAGQYAWGGAQYDYVWVFALLILVLMFRPQGFLGRPERVRA